MKNKYKERRKQLILMALDAREATETLEALTVSSRWESTPEIKRLRGRLSRRLSLHMLKKDAWLQVGGLSNPSKMPCKGWSIPAVRCVLGSKLRMVEGSTCASCYALKGTYVFPVVKNALENRYQLLSQALNDPEFREVFISSFEVLLNGHKYFRWHDAGDLQGHAHLELICEIARRLPGTQFWLPTRESALVNTFLGEIPDNLLIRVSSNLIDGNPPAGFGNTSTVHSSGSWKGKECRAYTRSGHCGACRACWKPAVDNVSYRKH